MFLVSIAGAAANLLTALLVLLGMSATVAVVWAATGASPFDIMQFLIMEQPGPDAQGFVVAFTYYMVMVNLLLAFFNLLPLPPLDGFRALTSLIAMLRGPWRPRRQHGVDTPPEPEGAARGVAPLSPAEMHFSIGLEYHQAGQYDEAIARYRQALAHDKDYALAYYNEGLAYWAKGRLPLAVSAFRAVLEASDHSEMRIPASLRLRELAQVQQESGSELVPVPPPMDPGNLAEPAEDEAPPLDPALARRVWLQLGIGGTAMLIGAFAVWLFITAVVLAGVV
jgi:tetratricopeptide (TPR) repeat protein